MAATDILSTSEALAAVRLTGQQHSTEVAGFVTAISTRIDTLVGPVVQRTVTGERHNGDPCGVIHPRQTPVASVTTVVEWDSDGTSTSLTAETDSTKPANGYLLVGTVHDQRILRRSSGVTVAYEPGDDNIVVTYTAGRYANTAAVDPLYKTVAATILRRLWQREARRWAQGPGFGDELGDDFTSGFFRAVDPVVRELLFDQLKPVATGIA